jgi:hypothetical protein
MRCCAAGHDPSLDSRMPPEAKAKAKTRTLASCMPKGHTPYLSGIGGRDPVDRTVDEPTARNRQAVMELRVPGACLLALLLFSAQPQSLTSYPNAFRAPTGLASFRGSTNEASPAPGPIQNPQTSDHCADLRRPSMVAMFLLLFFQKPTSVELPY